MRATQVKGSETTSKADMKEGGVQSAPLSAQPPSMPPPPLPQHRIRAASITAQSATAPTVIHTRPAPYVSTRGAHTALRRDRTGSIPGATSPTKKKPVIPVAAPSVRKPLAPTGAVKPAPFPSLTELDAQLDAYITNGNLYERMRHTRIHCDVYGNTHTSRKKNATDANEAYSSSLKSSRQIDDKATKTAAAAASAKAQIGTTLGYIVSWSESNRGYVYLIDNITRYSDYDFQSVHNYLNNELKIEDPKEFLRRVRPQFTALDLELRRKREELTALTPKPTDSKSSTTVEAEAKLAADETRLTELTNSNLEKSRALEIKEFEHSLLKQQIESLKLALGDTGALSRALAIPEEVADAKTVPVTTLASQAASVAVDPYEQVLEGLNNYRDYNHEYDKIRAIYLHLVIYGRTHDKQFDDVERTKTSYMSALKPPSGTAINPKIMAEAQRIAKEKAKDAKREKSGTSLRRDIDEYGVYNYGAIDEWLWSNLKITSLNTLLVNSSILFKRMHEELKSLKTQCEEAPAAKLKSKAIVVAEKLAAEEAKAKKLDADLATIETEKTKAQLTITSLEKQRDEKLSSDTASLGGRSLASTKSTASTGSRSGMNRAERSAKYEADYKTCVGDDYYQYVDAVLKILKSTQTTDQPLLQHAQSLFRALILNQAQDKPKNAQAVFDEVFPATATAGGSAAVTSAAPATSSAEHIKTLKARLPTAKSADAKTAPSQTNSGANSKKSNVHQAISTMLVHGYYFNTDKTLAIEFLVCNESAVRSWLNPILCIIAKESSPATIKDALNKFVQLMETMEKGLRGHCLERLSKAIVKLYMEDDRRLLRDTFEELIVSKIDLRSEFHEEIGIVAIDGDFLKTLKKPLKHDTYAYTPADSKADAKRDTNGAAATATPTRPPKPPNGTPTAAMTAASSSLFQTPVRVGGGSASAVPPTTPVVGTSTAAAVVSVAIAGSNTGGAPRLASE